MHPPAELFGVEPPFTAGALAATNSTVFAGHYTGHYSKINADTLELEFTSDPFFACACQGLQVFEQSLILFGNDIGSSTSEPHDWHGHLRQVRDNKLIAQLALPAGNWAMVKNIRGSIACLYDRSEKQGTLAINMQSQSVAWHIPLAPTVVNYDAEKLVALGEALTILDLRTGTIGSTDRHHNRRVRTSRKQRYTLDISDRVSTRHFAGWVFNMSNKNRFFTMGQAT